MSLPRVYFLLMRICLAGAALLSRFIAFRGYRAAEPAAYDKYVITAALRLAQLAWDCEAVPLLLTLCFCTGRGIFPR